MINQDIKIKKNPNNFSFDIEKKCLHADCSNNLKMKGCAEEKNCIIAYKNNLKIK